MAEWTRAGVRDGSWMEGVDLWDEVNGDYKNTTGLADAAACAALCRADNAAAADDDADAAAPCGAWTFTAGSAATPAARTTCRLKADAARSLQVTTCRMDPMTYSCNLRRIPVYYLLQL